MKFDVCVIGSGAGGALCAYGLQKRGFNTLILEKGAWAKQGLNIITAFTNYYRDQGFVGSFGNTYIGIPTGEVVGGTTKINSGTCFNTPREVLVDWNKRLNMNIGYEDLSPHFSELTQLLSIAPVEEKYVAQGNKLFVQGLESFGFKNHFRLLRTGRDCRGSGRCCFICPNEAKQSTDIAIVPKFLALGGSLISETEVFRIEEDKTSVTLWCKNKGKNKKIKCSKLIIAAGSLSSPVLIRKNKIGTAYRQAGAGLTMHPATKVFAMFDKPLYGWQGVPQAIGFKHPDFPTLSFEGVFTPPSLSGLVMPVEAERLNSWLQNYDSVASFGVMVKDTHSGTVSTIPGLGLFIRYHLHQKDFGNLIEAVRFMGLCYLKAGAQKVLLPLNGVQNEFNSLETLQNFDFSCVKPSQLYSMGFHPLGTCGINRVVDSHLKVLGSRHIYVADGSVVPTSLGVNPQITIMALALRLAEELQ